MKRKKSILDEIHDYRDELARQHGYDLRRMAKPLQDPLLFVSTRGSNAELRAPAVVVPRTLRMGLKAEDRAGTVHSSSTEITVDPLPADTSLAPGMAWDCAPFLHGVASGESRANSVTLWTRIG